MLSKLLTLLFPPDEKERAIEDVHALASHVTRKTLPSGEIALTCAPYDDTAVRAAISLLKKRGNPHATRLLGALLADVVLEELADMHIWSSAHICIVPVPISKRRRRERGFNHMERICTSLPHELRSLVRTNVLLQTKHVPMQKTLSRSARLANVAGVFEVINPTEVAGTHIILVDDVTTTGATLAEAIRVLKNCGASVTAVALAHA